MDNSFSTKEIVIEQGRKLDKFMDKIDERCEQYDNRIDNLEKHRDSVMSNFKLIGWLIAGGGLIGLYGIVRTFIV